MFKSLGSLRVAWCGADPKAQERLPLSIPWVPDSGVESRVSCTNAMPPNSEFQMHNTSLDREREAGAVPARSKLNEPSPARSTSSVQVVKRKSEFLRTFVRRARRNFVREMWDWAQCSEIVIPSVNQLRETISVLSSPAQVFEEEFPESPIFLLAAGWRSGSTLLQRILVTDPSVLLWGEPFGEMALASGLATLLCRLSTFEGLAELSAEKEGTFFFAPDIVDRYVVSAGKRYSLRSACSV